MNKPNVVKQSFIFNMVYQIVELRHLAMYGTSIRIVKWSELLWWQSRVTFNIDAIIMIILKGYNNVDYYSSWWDMRVVPPWDKRLTRGTGRQAGAPRNSTTPPHSRRHYASPPAIHTHCTRKPLPTYYYTYTHTYTYTHLLHYSIYHYNNISIYITCPCTDILHNY